MQTSDFWTRITSLCGSPTSPVIFCIQNSVPSIWNTCLHVSQPSCVVFGCNTAHFGPEFQVSMGPRPHLWFWAHITASLTQRKYWIQPSPVALCMQNSDFRPRITSLCRWRDPTCGFCMQNSAFWTRVTSLYGSLTWPVVLCMYNSGLNIRISCLYGSQPSSVVLYAKSVISIRITSFYGSQPSCLVFGCKAATCWPE